MAGTGAEDEVRKVIDETLEAQNAGDAVRLRAMLSGRPDAVHIGTDPEGGGVSRTRAAASGRCG